MPPMVFKVLAMKKKKKKKDNKIVISSCSSHLLSGLAEFLGNFNNSIAMASCL